MEKITTSHIYFNNLSIESFFDLQEYVKISLYEPLQGVIRGAHVPAPARTLKAV